MYSKEKKRYMMRTKIINRLIFNEVNYLYDNSMIIAYIF